jgi:small subunit ribosomal protein S19
MSRSIWKGNYISKSLFRQSLKKKKMIKVWSRSSTIPYFLIDKNVYIHNGKEFRKVFVNRQKIGYKFGEFSFTRNFKRKVEKKQVKNATKSN